jgi:hypothetical protein
MMYELPTPHNEKRKANDDVLVKQTLLRPVAQFLDGMSRAAIFSFGPSLVYRLTSGAKAGKLGLNCFIVAYPLAVVVAAFFVGRLVGNTIALTQVISTARLPRYVARLAGLAIALHVFTFGAGLTSWWWLVAIRFLSAILVGGLCGITRPTPQEEDEEEAEDSVEERLESGGSRRSSRTKLRECYVDLASGTTKIYMTSFAVSIITGGLFYRHATGDATFKALTNSHRFTLSPLFLITISITAESILRCVFAMLSPEFNKPGLTQRGCPTSTSQMLDSDEITHALPRILVGPEYQMMDKSEFNSLKFFTPMKSTASPTTLHDCAADFTQSQFPDSFGSTKSDNFSPCRERFGTTDSDFFDCNSVLSEMGDFPDEDPNDENDEASNHAVARYKDRRCVYANGLPAFVPQGDSADTVPPNYLDFYGEKNGKAATMWKTTQKWRREQNIWRIHSCPNRWFPKIKKSYPHFLHGVSKQGYPVIYEQPGKMSLKGLFRGGCEISDMLRHFAFLMEYICNHVCTSPEVRDKLGPNAPPHSSSTWGFLVVMDVQGAGISRLSGDVLMYLKSAGDMGASHYPLNMKRAFLVNSPFWLAGVWSTVKGILPDSVQADILSSSKYGSALREYIDEDQIPREYGGTSPYALGQHPFELGLYDLVEQADKGADDPFIDSLYDLESPDGPLLFDHNTSSWTGEGDGGTLDNHDNLMTSGQTPQPLRRRGASVDQTRSALAFASSSEYDNEDRNKGNKPGGEVAIFTILSIMHVLWSAVQGILETAIPLWILTPTLLGGLGYAPSRSGVAMFCSAIVLLWVMRTKVSRVIAKIPSKFPMRSFRIGVGAQSVLLLLLATVPKSVG